MRVIDSSEPLPEEFHARPRKSYEFSDHERAIILNMAQGAGRNLSGLDESQLAKIIERFGNMRSHCTDPETYPPEVVEMFDDMYTVPAYLMFERFENESLAKNGKDNSNRAK